MKPIQALRIRSATAGSGVAHGPISFVGSGVFSDNSGSAPTFNFSSLLDTGGGTPTTVNLDFAIGIWACHCNGGDQVLATPSGWTKRQDLYINNGLDTNFGVYHKFLDGVESSVTFDNSHAGAGNSAIAGGVHVFRGVDTTTPFDVADTTASGTGTGHPDPSAITPSTAGSWIVVAAGAGKVTEVGGFTLPGDLSATTNHFRSTFGNGTNDAIAGMGIKTNWSSGAFDPGAWAGDSTHAANSWQAVTMALRSAP